MKTINDDLIAFSKLGNLPMVKALVENGADIHADDDDALQWSAYYGHLSVVKYLVENGADVNAGNGFALQYATYYGHSDIVEYLKRRDVCLK